MHPTFNFELYQVVKLVHLNEKGTVIGRAEYTEEDPRYFVRCQVGNGLQSELWLDGSAIEAA